MITDKKHLTTVARAEIETWDRGIRPLPRGLAIAILFAFIHRVTTGETVEQTFFGNQSKQPDYEI